MYVNYLLIKYMASIIPPKNIVENDNENINNDNNYSNTLIIKQYKEQLLKLEYTNIILKKKLNQIYTISNIEQKIDKDKENEIEDNTNNQILNNNTTIHNTKIQEIQITIHNQIQQKSNTKQTHKETIIQKFSFIKIFTSILLPLILLLISSILYSDFLLIKKELNNPTNNLKDNLLVEYEAEGCVPNIDNINNTNNTNNNLVNLVDEIPALKAHCNKLMNRIKSLDQKSFTFSSIVIAYITNHFIVLHNYLGTYSFVLFIILVVLIRKYR